MRKLNLVLVSIHVRPGPESVPLAAACIASSLKADAVLSSILSISMVEAFSYDDAKSLAASIARSHPDLVGFSLYLWNRDLSMDVAKRARSLLGETVFFAGGPDATARPSELVVSDGGPFDFVVVGEGESPTIAAIRALSEGGDFAAIRGVFLGGEAPRRSGAEDVASLPSPWLDGTLDATKRDGVLWELARGCPYACTYCYESKGERRVRYMDEGRISAELDSFARAEVPSVFVLDPTFNADKDRARRLLDMITTKAPGSRWHFEIRAESLDRDLANRFAKLGASLQIGLQTARPEVAAKVGRKLDRGAFASKIGFLNDAGAIFGLDLIYGLPGDNFAGYASSLDYALSLYPNNLDLFQLAVLPGTALADSARSDGLVFDPEPPYLVRSSSTFSEVDILAAARLSAAADLFYNRGRAVAWFNQVLHPLGMKASLFLLRFADFLDHEAKDHRFPAKKENDRRWDFLIPTEDPVGIERFQLAHLDEQFASAKLDYLLPAVWDIVRFNGAWARALAEEVSTDIAFNYDPNEVLSPGAMDLEHFVTLAEPRPCRVRVKPGKDEPRVLITE